MASTKDWFETVAEAQRRAKKRVPKSVYLALLAGSERGISYGDNVAAFGELGFAPRLGVDIREKIVARWSEAAMRSALARAQSA